MCTSFAPRVQIGGGKASSPLDPEEPSLSSIKQTPFFHCTIARLAAAHTVLMAEISGHALTDLSCSLHVNTVRAILSGCLQNSCFFLIAPFSLLKTFPLTSPHKDLVHEEFAKHAFGFISRKGKTQSRELKDFT